MNASHNFKSIFGFSKKIGLYNGGTIRAKPIWSKKGTLYSVYALRGWKRTIVPITTVSTMQEAILMGPTLSIRLDGRRGPSLGRSWNNSTTLPDIGSVKVED